MGSVFGCRRDDQLAYHTDERETDVSCTPFQHPPFDLSSFLAQPNFSSVSIQIPPTLRLESRKSEDHRRSALARGECSPASLAAVVDDSGIRNRDSVDWSFGESGERGESCGSRDGVEECRERGEGSEESRDGGKERSE